MNKSSRDGNHPAKKKLTFSKKKERCMALSVVPIIIGCYCTLPSVAIHSTFVSLESLTNPSIEYLKCAIFSSETNAGSVLVNSESKLSVQKTVNTMLLQRTVPNGAMVSDSFVV